MDDEILEANVPAVDEVIVYYRSSKTEGLGRAGSVTLRPILELPNDYFGLTVQRKQMSPNDAFHIHIKNRPYFFIIDTGPRSSSKLRQELDRIYDGEV